MRDRHSLWTFSKGPLLVDVPLYVFEATLAGVDILTWRMQEEEDAMFLYRAAVARVRVLNHEERARYQPAPYPLVHLMKPRRLTSSR